MISASLSLSLPRLGWKSTSTPRSLKICTAAGESASEMRTLGFDIGVIRVGRRLFDVVTCGLDPGSISLEGGPGQAGHDEWDGCCYAAFGSAALASANAQSIHCVSRA